MKTSIALLLSLLCTAVAVGQHNAHTCASGTLHNQLLDNDTVYHRNFLHFEHRIEQMHQDLDQRVSVVHSLPVVVHILHEGESLGTGSNITDEQIFSAITALNEDFRKLPGTNGDGDGVDVELEFCLAARDPEGNSTTGIDLSDAGEPALQIYPNPGNGDAISIAIENLPGGLHVIQCELYNAAGGMVETFQLSVGSGAAAQHRFHQRLSTGVYILRYTTDTSLPREIRLMVQ